MWPATSVAADTALPMQHLNVSPVNQPMCVNQSLGCESAQHFCCRTPLTDYFYNPGMGPYDYCCLGASEARNRTKVSTNPDTFIMTCCRPIENTPASGTPCASSLECCGGYKPETQDHPTVCKGEHPLSQPQGKRCMYCGTANDGPYNKCQLDSDCCPGQMQHKRICVGAVNNAIDPDGDKPGRCCGGIDPSSGQGDYCGGIFAGCCGGLKCTKVPGAQYSRCAAS